MGEISSICVYCGSHSGTKPIYQEAARTLGKAIAVEGIRLIYGGASIGLMGTVARAVLAHGGAVTGIIPEFLQQREARLEQATEIIVTDSMHTRKQLMFEKADGFIALPGGMGTLEEISEMLTWGQLEQHMKPVVLANIDNFWSPLVELIDHMRDEGFIQRNMDITYTLADRAEDILPKLHVLNRFHAKAS